ncbi:hypothetical protein LINGRAHAP2_LOCUS9257 [Linum grandiflorum]
MIKIVFSASSYVVLCRRKIISVMGQFSTKCRKKNPFLTVRNIFSVVKWAILTISAPIPIRLSSIPYPLKRKPQGFDFLGYQRSSQPLDACEQPTTGRTTTTTGRTTTTTRFSASATGMGRKRKDAESTEEGRKNFTWNQELDQLLVRFMIEMVEQRKVDDKGNFVAGAYKEIELMMEDAKPGCGVKWDPNILSRCKTLKNKFLAIQELRGLSGSGWDEKNKMVLLDDHVFAEYVKGHKNCAKMNRYPFALYDGLEYVFGKGRATGTKAVGPDDLDVPCPKIEQPSSMMLGWKKPTTNGEMGNDGRGDKEEDYINLDEQVTPPTPADKGNGFEKENQSEATSKRKKKSRRNITTDETEGNEDDYLKLMLEKTVKSIEAMVGETETTNKQRMTLYKEVVKIDGITPSSAMNATVRIVKDPFLTRLFFGLETDEERKMFIENVVNGP